MIKSISISAIADLHGHLPQMQGSDLTVVAGDIFPGALDKDLDGQEEWFRAAFLPWVEKQECNHVILVAGNHDHWIAKNNAALMKEFAPEQLKKLIYLCDNEMVFKGARIYGTPWMPTPFVNKAFSLSNDNQLREKYAHIPQDVDLLITHTVPYDCNYIGFSDRDMRDLGSKELREAVATRNIRFLVGGHIHETKERIAHMDFGERHTEMANVACCDNQKQPIRQPIRFTVSVQKEPVLFEPYRVACVGDSITYGFGLKDIKEESYPSRLGKLLGLKYEVKNFGRSGAGLWKGGAFPYTSTIEYFRAVDYDANIYVICLGTNDLVQTIDNKFIAAFKEDLWSLINAFEERSVPCQVFVTTILPVPQLFKPGEDEPVRKINKAIASVVRARSWIRLIDLYKAFKDNASLFSHGVHPNADGARLIAETVYKTFKRTLPEHPRHWEED